MLAGLARLVSGHGRPAWGRTHRRIAATDRKTFVFMKSRKAATHENENGDGVSHTLAAKAATAKHLADMARKHYKMLKAEYKQARKAYKQARKAARRARKEAKAAMKLLRAQNETARLVDRPRKLKRAQKMRRAHAGSTSTIPLPTASTATA